MSGFAQLKQVYEERGKRARQLRESGNKVVGYFCCFVPEEIISALGMVPYRIQGSQRAPIDQADACIEPMSCPFVRSCFNLALNGKYDFLDGFVVPHSCDTIERIYHLWRHYRPAPFSHYVNVPHMIRDSSEPFYRAELENFARRLGDWSGAACDPSRLMDAVELYNRRRAKLRELYELRKENPPRVTGSEITVALVAGMGLPATEHIALLDEFIAEIQARPRPDGPKLPRVFVWGNEIDDVAFIRLIEECGASVIMDDLCTGSRFFWDDVPRTEDPLEGLASRYLRIHCPRSYIPKQETREADLRNRFGYIGEFVRDWNAEAAIFYIIRYCDTSELEAPDLREYLNGLNVPVLMIEDDYSISTIAQLRTRIQAFLEMIAG